MGVGELPETDEIIPVVGNLYDEFLREDDPVRYVLQETDTHRVDPFCRLQVDDNLHVPSFVALPSAQLPFGITAQSVDQCVIATCCEITAVLAENSYRLVLYKLLI